MAKTRGLNDEGTAWVTTYAGREGRCYDITMQLDEDTQATHTFTEEELKALLKARGLIRGLMKPEMI